MRKAQGEIFGVALFFVIIIVGIIVYIQIQAFTPDRDADLQQEAEYKILAEGSMNTLLELSTGCFVERGQDSIQDLINFCLEYSFVGDDPQFTCSSGPVLACEHSMELLNDSLFGLYNSSVLGPILYEMRIEVPANEDSLLNQVVLTNFGQYQYRGQNVTYDNYRDLGFKRAPSGLKTWATAQRNINVELYLYYR